ncbi:MULTISPECIES: glycosyltransferase family 4 protein [unclassified Roseovarius]|uniref:glycosyltransferase family 4 protein n=1 Tax=unclassified Roseovarius TaxID=2614913 RepID=UPI00273DF08B|nr:MULTISPECIES: glycosyltransferase family 4 protein [unclassified Roseovarius]
MSERPSVMFVSRKWPPAMGGMETYSKELSDALRRYAEVETLALPGRSDGSVPGKGALLWFGLRAAIRLFCARSPAKITHVADMASWPLALCARIRSPRGRRVLSAHGTDVAYPLRGGAKGRIYGSYLRLGARCLGHVTVIANSEATAKAANRYGFHDTLVVPLAAEVTAGAPSSPGKSLLFSGRLVPRKGLAWFVREVLPLLPDTMTLDVAGTVWDTAEAAALDHPRVRHLGRLDQAELWCTYASAVCVIVPNIDVPNGEFEGFGLVALEAAAAGGIVLASHHSGLKEAVLDGQTGFHITPGDPRAWADKIMEIASWDDAQRSDFTGRAKDLCNRHFSWDRVATDTLSAYASPRAGGTA